MVQRRVLITGGAGFIGGHIADAYLSRGDKVWIVDDLSSGKLTNVPDEAEFVRMDIGDNDLEALFREVGGFDIVNHHAAQIDVRVSVANPRLDAKVNVDGFLNVVENAVRYRAKRFLFVSSGGTIYGDTTQLPSLENTPLKPLCPYAVSKVSAEYYLNYFQAVHGLDTVTLRYGNVYGPRQDPHGEAGVVAIFSNRILAGEPLTIFGTGEQTRDYVYIGDVVRANLLFSEVPLPASADVSGRSYNIGTGRGTSVKELAQKLMRAADRTVDIAKAPARTGELMHTYLDVSRAGLVAGWTPEVSLDQGLKQTFDYFASQQAMAL